jgi:hypothetical protein
MTAAPDLSIILINWNSLEVTNAALASLRDQTKKIAYEVFVVDNRSIAMACGNRPVPCAATPGTTWRHGS